ncbi:hypothetical protein BVX94_01810 [bacterium B17]|nr:hypothetical protein BVX94_01810 [bacterium B17]
MKNTECTIKCINCVSVVEYMFRKIILTIVLLASCICSVFAEDASGAKDPIIAKWKFGATVLDFKADGSVHTSFDDETYRKWENAKNVDRAYYMTGPGYKYDVILSEDGKSIKMPQKKRVYKRIDTVAAKKKKPKSKWQFFVKIGENNLEEVDSILNDYPELIKEKELNNLTPLHKAKSKEMIELLLTRDADINAKNFFSDTPLHFSTNPVLTKVFLDNGADVTIRNKKAQTPLDKLIVEERFNIAEVMLTHEAGKPSDTKTWNRVYSFVKSREAKEFLNKYRYPPKKKPKKEKPKPELSAEAQRLQQEREEKAGGKFKILRAKLVDKEKLLDKQTRSEKSLVSATQWERLPIAVEVTFEIEIPDAEPGKISTFMINEIYLNSAKRNYPFIGLKRRDGGLYQGPGITFHSNKNGKFAWKRNPRVTMFFLIPPPALKARLVFKGVLVAEARITDPDRLF